MAKPCTTAQLQHVVNHVFLPPKLPQSADDGSEGFLVDITLEALVRLRDQLKLNSHLDAVDNAISLITKIKTIHSLNSSNIDEVKLRKELVALPTGSTIAAKIDAQNAAVLVTRLDHQLVFEAFELSPTNKAAMSTQGRLIRSFPGLAVAVDADLLAQADFSDMVANTLATMCQQKAPETQPQARKAGQEHDEERDTTDPLIVTQLFMGSLRAMGKEVKVTAISKNTREEVLWAHTLAPWRRSPMWLLIRVALQLVISRSPDGSQTLYKEVMLSIMDRILKSALDNAHRLPADMVYAMTAKIHRRCQKLSGTSLQRGLVDIKSTLRRASDLLSSQWLKVQQNDARDLQLNALATLEFSSDTWINLPALDKHLEALSSRSAKDSAAGFTPASQLVAQASRDLPVLPTGQSNSTFAARLAQFEEWVDKDILDWTTINSDKEPCEKLYGLMVQYHGIASRYYSGNPEAMSLMLLTAYELWVAIDKAASNESPLLHTYDPDMPTTPLQNLLLPTAAQMERLSNVEAHLNKRKTGASKSSLVMFSSNNGSSFANEYVRLSTEHQALLARIQSAATSARQAKVEEYRRVKAEFHRLSARFESTDHDYLTRIVDEWCNPPETEEIHRGDCQKCSYNSQLGSLMIELHEWPLPTHSAEVAAVVFELQVPTWFASWRSARSFVVQDVLKGWRPPAQPETSYKLSSNDPHLTSSHFRRQGPQRIGLLSETKPVVNTHYKSKHISTLSETQVCVANGLQYQYHDSSSDTYMVGNFTFDGSILRACTYTLPNPALQAFVDRPASAPDGPQPNTVLSRQNACPETMSLEEFKELSTIPLGRHIQWANILLQLTMPGVDWKKPDTTLVFLQCIYQAGPAGVSSTLRENHDVFRSESTTLDLLKSLTGALQRVKDNWESSEALRVFVAIAVRTLSLSTYKSAQTAALRFLAAARDVALGWVLRLREKAYAAVDHVDRTAFISKSLEVALICALTFDVDDVHVPTVLSEDASALIQASIVVQEGTTGEGDAQLPSMLLLRHRRMLYRFYSILAEYSSQIDDAIHKSWSAFQPAETEWSLVSDHWLTKKSVGDVGLHVAVHYDLLSGELLVNGLPLHQPPQAYRETALYKCLFGKAIVEVMPSTVSGFEFSAKRRFDGWDIQLGLQGSEDLAVRAHKDGRTFETVPRRIFASVYPTHFSDDYVQWLDHATGRIDFRPDNEPWNATNPSNWTLLRDADKEQWQLSRSARSVVGVNSPTSTALAHVLNSLADKTRIHCILQPCGTTLGIAVPILRLNFTLANGSTILESKEFRSMAIDKDQAIGTLVGMQNKIVLKPLSGGERMVLVAEASDVIYSQKNGHVSISVPTQSIRKVHALHIDTLLGRLVDNGDIGCKLFMAYLHALSSFCVIDPLTHKTGVEQALTLLKCAAVRSFDQLSQAHVDLLLKISRLSPGRSFYPSHLQVMQTVKWDGQLSFMSQDGQLLTAVQAILEQAQKQSHVFFPEIQLKFPTQYNVDQHLLKRDEIRSATFKVSQFGADAHTRTRDRQYAARDRRVPSAGAIRASSLCSLVLESELRLHEPAPNSRYLWKQLAAFDIINGPHLLVPMRSLKYDAGLLRESSPDGWTLVREGHSFVAQRLPALHRLLSMDTSAHKFSIMIWLATLAFAPNAEVSMLQVVAMLSKSPALTQILPPAIASYKPQEGKDCDRSTLTSIVRRGERQCPKNYITRQTNEKLENYNNRRRTAWRAAMGASVREFVDGLVAQWPTTAPQEPSGASHFATYLDVRRIMTGVTAQFTTWHDNKTLFGYLMAMEDVIEDFPVVQFQGPNVVVDHAPRTPSQPGFVSNESLFLSRTPELPKEYQIEELVPQQNQQVMKRVKEPLLQSVIDILNASSTASNFEKEYASDLCKSFDALVAQEEPGAPSSDFEPATLSRHLIRCQDRVRKMYDLIAAVLFTASSDPRTICHLPRVSPTFLLEQLSRSRWSRLSPDWKRTIVDYGLALVALQRAERLVRMSQSSRREDLCVEIQNSGHSNWDPMEFPESLLLEVESGLVIRPVQEEIAKQMRDPLDGKNAVMQLNMGEGKSSVIVPIVAASLADGKRLTRVIVAKPQSKQMAQMLISKLGGLLGRRVYHLPFSRSLQLTITDAQYVSTMLRECMSNGGILLVQPEHILSYKLMAPECYITDKESIGRELMSTQDFLDGNSRDIVDESDENFAPRFELIYTMGSQRSIELSPDRWLLVQQVLDVIRLLAPALAEELPSSFEYHPGTKGSFPRVRILRPDAGSLLLSRLANHICQTGLHGLVFSRQSEKVRQAIHTYITKSELDAVEISAVEESLFWTESTKAPLLLVRGLIAGGVLEFVLSQKRWRVNYGLATRIPATQLAVPFRAKDSPSPRSEFSHPDVVIALTSLSYYYGGLSDGNLFTALGHLMDSDQSEIEYQAWVRDSPSLPTAFRQLQGINLKDRPQCITEVFPALYQAKSVVDYFLAHIVFPKEMKEFPHKLSASGWDLGKRKAFPTTGFSGTKDSSCVLPFDVDHLDLPEQKHTNALVLEYILQPENAVEVMGATADGISDAEHLLEKVLGLEPPVEVILDVGAQILELTNIDVAKAWLAKHDTTKEAAVFVDDDDELRVVDHDGRVDLLRTSSYATRLDACLVFLDEVHTRGIDLKLPVHYRAAVTLGAGLTKDRLVQACMRLRKLGKGQTVVFCISPEIEAKIIARMPAERDPSITLSDVLLWSIAETHTDIRRCMPLWAAQGERFVRQEKLWNEHKQDGHTVLSKAHAEQFQEAEAQSIDQRYRPRVTHSPPAHVDTSDPEMQRIATRCQLFEGLDFNSSTLQEEQERELSPEIEQERQVERAAPAEPLAHQLHQDVRQFALSGVFNPQSTAYTPAFQALQDSSAAQHLPPDQFMAPNDLLVSTDFIKTVKPQGGASYVSDAFQRSVQWLLALRTNDMITRILIISPYEANKLYTEMQHSQSATLHVYKPRSNSGYAPLDQLKLHTIGESQGTVFVPSALAAQLNLFAGQLYISTYQDYLAICDFLGLCATALTREMGEQGWQVATDGFILRDGEGRVGGESGLEKSPVSFVKVLMSTIRRNGDGITKTHMGQLLEGGLLYETDF